MLMDIVAGHAFFGEYVFMILCMAAAWMTGRSIASDWKPLWNLALSVLGLWLSWFRQQDLDHMASCHE